MSEPSESASANLAVGERLVELNEASGPEGVLEHFEEIFDPEFEWHPAVSGLGEKVYVGREGFREWLGEIGAVATTDFSDFAVRAVGDHHLLFLCRLRLVGRESGLDLDSEYGMLARLERARAVWARAFLSHAEAEEAARAR